ncbi:hypothetical protein [Shewanella surugensis]|uniref:DUF2607 family protein n=1 Tax=Shewanella surugensis TaxID=212020 RepID=A0ABT0LIF4_9GAMM|nr:hypothetical protein [Shewanella surugensis]MCL1127477.1 hypothetical protein [Shewanella surugensis]
MTHRIPLTLKNSLWLVFGLWLIVLQSITLAHGIEHALEHDNTHCLYSNIYHHHHAGPTTVIMPAMCQQQAGSIAPPLYQQPSLLWLRNLNVRAPPF